MSIGNQLKDMIFKRLRIEDFDLKCPREKSDTTPCVARDGDLAMTDDFKCVGCGMDVYELLDEEKRREL